MHGQNSLLERDISKRDSLAGRRRDSVIDKSSKAFDNKRLKSVAVPLEQTLQVLAVLGIFLIWFVSGITLNMKS